MFSEMLSGLLTYDVNDLDSVTRMKVADILKTRAEVLHATAEATQLRARVWAGEESLTDLAEAKAAELYQLRENYAKLVHPFAKSAIDVDSLVELIPMILDGVLQSVKVPIPLLMEIFGADIDNIKNIANGLKKINEED